MESVSGPADQPAAFNEMPDRPIGSTRLLQQNRHFSDMARCLTLSVMRIKADVRLSAAQQVELARTPTDGIEQTFHRGCRFVALERCPPNKNARRALAGHPVRVTP